MKKKLKYCFLGLHMALLITIGCDQTDPFAVDYTIESASFPAVDLYINDLGTVNVTVKNKGILDGVKTVNVTLYLTTYMYYSSSDAVQLDTTNDKWRY